MVVDQISWFVSIYLIPVQFCCSWPTEKKASDLYVVAGKPFPVQWVCVTSVFGVIARLSPPPFQLFLPIDPSELALHEHFWRHLFSSHLLFGLYLLLFCTALWFPIWGDSIAWWLRWWILTQTAEFKPVLCHSLVSSSVKWDKGQPSTVPGPQEVLVSHYRFSTYCCYSWFGLPSLFTPSCRSLQI